MYYDDGIVDTFDAAVVSKNEHGKVKIVKKHEQPLRQGAWVGGGLGLATGLCVALFPAVTLGAGLVWGTGIGAGLGALAGHAAAGMSRSDLKDLGEHLDAGTAGLIVVGVSDMQAKIERAMKKAEKIEKKQLEADTKELEKDAKES